MKGNLKRLSRHFWFWCKGYRVSKPNWNGNFIAIKKIKPLPEKDIIQ